MLGSCTPADCAVSVIASVVSSPAGGEHSIVDAGALALSKDPGPGSPHPPTMGEIYEDYASGALNRETRVVSLSQEHGRVNRAFRIGERLRILPNHSCLTVAHFDEMHVVRGDQVEDRWKVWRGRDEPARRNQGSLGGEGSAGKVILGADAVPRSALHNLVADADHRLTPHCPHRPCLFAVAASAPWNK